MNDLLKKNKQTMHSSWFGKITGIAVSVPCPSEMGVCHYLHGSQSLSTLESQLTL
jgi:hypothetical protein